MRLSLRDRNPYEEAGLAVRSIDAPRGAMETRRAVDCHWGGARERERVSAGVDCGFAVFTDNAMMTEDICWAKFRALRAGTDLASSRL